MRGGYMGFSRGFTALGFAVLYWAAAAIYGKWAGINIYVWSAESAWAALVISLPFLGAWLALNIHRGGKKRLHEIFSSEQRSTDELYETHKRAERLLSNSSKRVSSLKQILEEQISSR